MVNVRPNIDPAARCYRLQDTQSNWSQGNCRGANHSTLERNNLVLFIYSFI